MPCFLKEPALQGFGPSTEKENSTLVTRLKFNIHFTTACSLVIFSSDILGRSAGWAYISQYLQCSKQTGKHITAIFLQVRFWAEEYNNHLRFSVLYQEFFHD